MIIEYPTFTQVTAIPSGTPVTATMRARSGERAQVMGEIHAPRPGQRNVGPVVLTRHIPEAPGPYGSRREARSMVDEGLVSIEYAAVG